MTAGKRIGGLARTNKMTPEQRKEMARKGVEARRANGLLPKATHDGIIKIMDVELPCYVLGDGQRVLSQRGMSAAFTGVRGGGLVAQEDGAQRTPRFLAKKGVKSFINNDLMARINSPVEFLPKAGRSAFGYDSALLPEICEAIIDAGKAQNKTDTREYVTAEILIRGLARVGIVALVDEATGYQRDRAKDALAKILEAFVAKELQPWVKTFPTAYYENLFRIYDLQFPPEGKPQWRPQFFGKITNDVVYSRLAPELLPELKKAATKADKKAKLHQWLSSEIGHPKLREHLASLVTLLKLSRNPQDFKRMVDAIHPRHGATKPFNFEDPGQ